MDLHPDASLAIGRMKPRGAAAKLFSWLARRIDRQADRVVALGPYMADRLLARGVRPNRLSVIPVWSRADEFNIPPRDENPIRRSLEITEKIVFMYSGNMGLAHQFEELLLAIERLKDRRDLLFLFVGGGPRLAEIERAVAERDLGNVRLLDSSPRANLADLLSAADVHLVTMRAGTSGIVVPGKLYGAMAACRPIVFIGPEHCETADTIREAECGATIRLGDVDGLAETLVALADSPETRNAMGERARAEFIARFERDVCNEHWSAMLDALLGTQENPSPIVHETAPSANRGPKPHIGPPRVRTLAPHRSTRMVRR
jgi:glycosyltransferase involved in cell wall biosynthesis